MKRLASLISLAALGPILAPALALALTSPALARGERHTIDVPASRLDAAIRALGRQTGTSIGFRDRQVAGIRVHATRGELTAGEALVLMLRGTGARARRVAAESFLIETDPAPEPARPPSPPPAAPLAITEPEPVEILVTATKREMPIGAYPGMAHIIGGERISPARGRHGSDLLAMTTASITSTHLGPGRNKLFIRGIADSSFVGPTQATVGQYWGNSRITYASPDPSLRLYDVSRIEVLEGPQGTLYGAGSLGGILRVVPSAPVLDRIEGAAWGGVEAVTHGEMGYDGGAVLNLPLVEERLALRAVGFGAVESGYIDDVGRGLDDINDVDSYGGRLALRYADDAGLTVDASLIGQRINGADSQYAEAEHGDLARSSAIAQPFRNHFLLADLVIAKSWGDYEFTASAGYADQYVFERFEGPALSDPLDSMVAPTRDAADAAYNQTNRSDMITAEARLAHNGPRGTGWLLAASYLRNEAETLRDVQSGGATTPLTGIANNAEELTAYGEATIAASESLQLTLGARLTHSRISGDALDAVLPGAIFAIDPSAEKSRGETEFLPSLAVTYQPREDLTLFARYQEGFRPGGIAVRREYVQRFRSDHVHTLEGGARFRGLDVEIETSASWTDWNQIQADLIDGYGFPTTANVGDGRVFSLGLAGRWWPAPGLELAASGYVNGSKVTQPYQILADIRAREDARASDRLPNIADATAHLSFHWWMPLGDAADLHLSGYGRYVGKSTLGIGPFLGRRQGDYVDTRLEAELRRGPIGYSLSIENLLDTRGNRFALGSPFEIRDANQTTPLTPRTIRLGVQVDF